MQKSGLVTAASTEAPVSNNGAEGRQLILLRFPPALRGVRARLVSLALASMLPVFLFAAAVTFHIVDREQEAIRTHGLELARLAVEEVDQEIAVARAMLVGISTTQALHDQNMEALYAQAREAAHRYGKPIGFVDREGNRRFVTFAPLGEPLPPHNAPDQLRLALETGQTQVSNLIPAPLRGDRAVVLMEPSVSGGTIAGVFGIEVDVAGIVARIATTKLPEQWLVAILDRNHTIIGRSRAAEQYVGTQATPDLRALIAASPSGTSRASTKEGLPVFTAYRQVRSTGWTVAVGVPEDVVKSPLDKTLITLLVSGLTLTALSIGTALAVARGISRPILSLTDAAGMLARGKTVPLAGVGLAEAEQVGLTLHLASVELEQRTDERAAAERRRRTADRRIQELQVELMHASRLSAVGALGATIAHEINQPLAAIANYLEVGRMLGEDTGCNPEVLDALDHALTQARRASTTIQHIRAFAAKHTVECRAEDVAAIVEEACVVGLVGLHDAGVHVERRVAPGCPSILADRVQVQQVLVNLIRNAVDAMGYGPRRHLMVSAAPNTVADMVDFTVADTGTGLDHDTIRTLFSPFRTTKANGMGIGLSISRTIVEAHGGRIWAEANPDGGALFRFSIPAALEKTRDEV